jgi:hypothetical protein
MSVQRLFKHCERILSKFSKTKRFGDALQENIALTSTMSYYKTVSFRAGNDLPYPTMLLLIEQQVQNAHALYYFMRIDCSSKPALDICTSQFLQSCHCLYFSTNALARCFAYKSRLSVLRWRQYGAGANLHWKTL